MPHLGQSLDDFVDQRGDPQLRDSGGVESAGRAEKGQLATVLGRTAERSGKADSAEWEVLVMADRGLYARWLFEAIWRGAGIRSCGSIWESKHVLVGEETFEWIRRWVPTPGTSWKGEVECFAGKKSRVNGTLLMHWEAGI